VAGVYQNDVQSLASIVGPAYAAQQAGMQNENANQEAQLTNQKSLATLPFAGPQAAADVANKQASTGLLSAEAQKGNLANLFTEATQPGAIKTAQAEGANKYSAAQAQSIAQVGQIAGQLAGVLDQVDPQQRESFMTNYLNSKGLNPQDFGPLASGDPDQLRNFSQKAIQAGAEYQTKMGEQGLRNEGAENVARLSTEARITASENAANARVQAVRIAQQTRQMSQTFEQAAVAAEKAGDHAGAQRYYQAAQNIRQMAAQTTAGLVGFAAPSPGFDQGGPGANIPQAGGQPGQPAAPVPTAQGTTVVGDTEYRQMPDGSWQSRKVQK